MRVENFQYLGVDDTVKFVCSSLADMERAIQLIRTYCLTQRCHVYVSPVFGEIQPAEMVKKMIAEGLNDVRLQIQIHKVIWDPNERGV